MGELNTAFQPVTYTNPKYTNKTQGRPAGADVYVIGFFICSGNKKLEKGPRKSSVLGIESCSGGVGGKS